MEAPKELLANMLFFRLFTNFMNISCIAPSLVPHCFHFSLGED